VYSAEKVLHVESCCSLSEPFCRSALRSRCIVKSEAERSLVKILSDVYFVYMGRQYRCLQARAVDFCLKFRSVIKSLFLCRSDESDGLNLSLLNLTELDNRTTFVP
jgi:hypothetical protein